MHSVTIPTNEGTFIFHFNSDFSGKVIIESRNETSMEVSGKALLEFVAYQYIQQKKIERIEEMSIDELLNVERYEID